MEPSDAEVAGIPPTNIRVSREEFVAVWRAASRRGTELGNQGITDWYVGAVSLTCRWVATAPMRTPRGGGLSTSPATRLKTLAYEELIEEEWLAAQLLEQSRPDLAAREGWCEGVRATLAWAWRRQGPPPIALPAVSTTL